MTRAETEVSASDVSPDTGGAMPCRGCGYDLRGQTQTRCPECGRTFFPRVARHPADIPWLRRRDIGTLRAFGETVELACRRPARLGEMAWEDVDVDLVEAPLFRQECLVVAVASLTGALAVSAETPDGMIAMLAAVPFVIWLVLGLDSVSWRLAPGDELDRVTDRADRLRYFALAPLALSPLVTLLAVVMRLFTWMFQAGPEWVRLAIVGVGFGAVLLAWWCVVVVFRTSASRARPARSIVYALALAATWAVIALVATAVGGVTVLVTRVMIDNLL